MSFKTEGMQRSEMSINLETILPSLAKNLYGDDWRITIRELLQNGHDAVAEEEKEAEKRGGKAKPYHIDVIPDLDAGTLIFRDNGIGMTLEEIERYLATVGYGRKREEIQRMAASGRGDHTLLDRLIGQYGIGFLSSFIIADQVEVLTRSQLDRAAPGTRAVFTGETSWYHNTAPEAPFGTQVTLKLKSTPVTDPLTGGKISLASLLNFERLKQEVRRFGDLLPYPLYVHRTPQDATGDFTNVMLGPWENMGVTEHDLLELLRRRHPGEDEPLCPMAFRFERETHGVVGHGMLYFPRSGQELRDSVARVELFCRRMFITEDLAVLLPDWATFVGVVVECPDLTPTLNRNDVIRHDPAFVALKHALGVEITSCLERLASERAHSFSNIRSIHRLRLYSGLLLDYEKSPRGEEYFFLHLIELVPFEVIDRTRPAGERMTLRKYREEFGRTLTLDDSETKRQRIYYLHSPQVTGQYRALIVQRDIPVIIATHPLEPPLLKSYGEAFRNDVIVQDAAEILDLYVSPIDQAPYEGIKQYLLTLQGDAPDEVTASRFEPSYIPAILVVGGAADPNRARMLEELRNEGAQHITPGLRRKFDEEIAQAKSGKTLLTIILNDNNRLVRTIRDSCSRGKRLEGALADVLHEVYHLARAQADPAAAESQHFFEHRNQLLLQLLELEHQLSGVQADHDRLKIEFDSMRRNPAPKAMEKRTCAMLLTDLRGSTRMVGFLDHVDSAAILQSYASELRRLVEAKGGRIEKFTGDGVFAHFGTDDGRVEAAVHDAVDCAWEIFGFTQSFFARGEVATTMLNAIGDGFVVRGSRTVVHTSQVMYGEMAGAPALVGKQVVALFRACDRDELFTKSPIILSHPTIVHLHLMTLPHPLVENVQLDPVLAPLTFYSHPNFASPGTTP